jgi:hypothetical protein
MCVSNSSTMVWVTWRGGCQRPHRQRQIVALLTRKYWAALALPPPKSAWSAEAHSPQSLVDVPGFGIRPGMVLH